MSITGHLACTLLLALTPPGHSERLANIAATESPPITGSRFTVKRVALHEPVAHPRVSSRFTSTDQTVDLTVTGQRFGAALATRGSNCDCLCGGSLVFVDGFETGNVSNWSSSQP